MRHFQKVAEGIDVSQVNAQLAENPHLWDQHSIRKTAPGTPHSRMSDIWVRYNDVAPYEASGNYAGFNDAHIPVWYEAFYALPALQPIIRELACRVGCEMLGGVLITRIPPGEGIARHTDSSWHVDYFEKFYLSLQSAPGSDFCCEHDGVTERLNPAPGEIYLFDNHKTHWVENNSDTDRVTAIICIRRLPA